MKFTFACVRFDLCARSITFGIRDPRRRAFLLYFFKLGLILAALGLVLAHINNTGNSADSDSLIGLSDDFVDIEAGEEDMISNNFQKKTRRNILGNNKTLVPVLLPLTVDPNPDRVSDFLTLRYWELLNSSLVRVKSNDEDSLEQVLSIPKQSDPYEKSFSLWRPRNLTVAGKAVMDKDDRLLGQMVLIMEGFNQTNIQNFKKKTIFISSSKVWWHVDGPELRKCPSLKDSCQFIDSTTHKPESTEIDAVIVSEPMYRRPDYAAAQNIFAFFLAVESNYINRPHLTRQNDILSSYWRGAGMVTPYAKWSYFDPLVKQKKQEKNYAEGKTKLVAIFVSNCWPSNRRASYIERLQKHVQVDVYGRCGKLQCPRSPAGVCFDQLKKDYKFYLSFENANCRDYITEKFWMTALLNDVVPVVMGAHPDDYEAVAPRMSYMHVEQFKTTKVLADYLTFLDKNDKEYNKYFEWKGTGTFVYSDYFCRVCAMLHYAQLTPPPPRTKPFDFGDTASNGLCLPRGQTYWTSALWILE